MRCATTNGELGRFGLVSGAMLAILALGYSGHRPAFAQAAAKPAAEAVPQPTPEAQKQPPQATPGKEISPDKKTKKASKGAKDGKTAKSPTKLPPYFGAVVTAEQRQTVYAIQKEYNEKIEPLRRQLESLTKQRDDKLNALLTPEQKQKIADLKATAKKATIAKKDAAKQAEAKPKNQDSPLTKNP